MNNTSCIDCKFSYFNNVNIVCKKLHNSKIEPFKLHKNCPIFKVNNKKRGYAIK